MMNSPLFPRGGKTYLSAKLEVTEKRTFRECRTGRRFAIRVWIVVLLYILHRGPERHPSQHTHTHHICTHHPSSLFQRTCLQLVMSGRLVAFVQHGPAHSTSPPSEMHLKYVF